MRVGDEYWAAATTGGWAPHFTLLRSRDLVNWESVGYVFREKPAWAKGDFWAPEIVSAFGRTFVFYTARRDEGPKRRGTLCIAGDAGLLDPTGPLGNVGVIGFLGQLLFLVWLIIVGVSLLRYSPASSATRSTSIRTERIPV